MVATRRFRPDPGQSDRPSGLDSHRQEQGNELLNALQLFCLERQSCVGTERGETRQERQEAAGRGGDERLPLLSGSLTARYQT